MKTILVLLTSITTLNAFAIDDVRVTVDRVTGTNIITRIPGRVIPPDQPAPPPAQFPEGIESPSIVVNPTVDTHGYQLDIDPLTKDVVAVERNSKRKTDAEYALERDKRFDRTRKVFENATNFWLNLNPPWTAIQSTNDLTKANLDVQWEQFCNVQINTNQTQATQATLLTGLATTNSVKFLNRAMNWLQNYNKGNSFLERLTP